MWLCGRLCRSPYNDKTEEPVLGWCFLKMHRPGKKYRHKACTEEKSVLNRVWAEESCLLRR